MGDGAPHISCQIDPVSQKNHYLPNVMNSTIIQSRLHQISLDRSGWGAALQDQILRRGPMTYTRFMAELAVTWMHRTALVFGGRELTYAQLFEHVSRARAVLRSKGVRPGDSVALLMNNSDHYVVWYLATLGSGAVAVPLNNRLVASEVAYILEHSDSSLLISEPSFEPLVVEVGEVHGVSLPVMLLDPLVPDSGLSQELCTDEVAVDFTSPAALYYTSGTTGRPKGVIHTHRSLIADALQSPQAWEYAFVGVRSLAVTPLFHIASHTIFFPVLFIGGTLVVDSYSTQATLHLLRDKGINAFFAVPSILLLMVDKAKETGLVLDGMRTLMFGAAPMTIAKLGEVQALFPKAGLIHGMGQTESGGTLVTLPSVAAVDRAGSVGMPMAGVEVAIFNERDEPVPPGEVGELVARGPNVMQGYFKNAAATQDTLRNDWLHTGDIGFQDPDGLVTLVDRKKDMIIRGGENIYSSEVEQVLLKHPDVKQAAVVGQPDALFGEQVAAFLVVDPAVSAPSPEALVAHCLKYLADYKIPVTFRFVPDFPLTATGKIRKTELREALPEYKRKPYE